MGVCVCVSAIVLAWDSGNIVGSISNRCAKLMHRPVSAVGV